MPKIQSALDERFWTLKKRYRKVKYVQQYRMYIEWDRKISTPYDWTAAIEFIQQLVSGVFEEWLLKPL